MGCSCIFPHQLLVYVANLIGYFFHFIFVSVLFPHIFHFTFVGIAYQALLILWSGGYLAPFSFSLWSFYPIPIISLINMYKTLCWIVHGLSCRLWDLGMQRCVHSYAVHTDSVWALASTPTFSHVYSGGRDLSVSSFACEIYIINFHSFWCPDFWYPILFIPSVVLDRLGNTRESFALQKRAPHFAVGITWWQYMGCDHRFVGS
jgi:hypothetical protein